MLWSSERTKAELTHSGVYFCVHVSCAVVLDEGGLTHPWATQEDHIEHALRTDSFALKFRQISEQKKPQNIISVIDCVCSCVFSEGTCFLPELGSAQHSQTWLHVTAGVSWASLSPLSLCPSPTHPTISAVFGINEHTALVTSSDIKLDMKSDALAHTNLFSGFSPSK